MNTFHLTFLEADRTFFDGECVSLQIPATDGAYGIMANHTNLICALIPGELKYRTADGEEKVASVSSGICKVENGEVLVLTESAEAPEEIDERRAEREAAEAKEEMLRRSSIQSYKAAQAKMARVSNRLRVKHKYK